MHSAQYWMDKLQLTPHVEGGAFKEVYRSCLSLERTAITKEHKGPRSASTAIYFLLQYGEFSAFHRIASDEVWHHYDGGCLKIYELTATGALITHQLGKDLDNDEQPVIVIPSGSWFASRVETPGGYSLCGCTVAPGFDFDDFELAQRGSLVEQYPQYMALITELTRQD